MRGENLPIIFGLKLRQFREAKGYGLKELSERVGLSPSYLNEIENGKKYPKADKILHLSEALEVPYDDLVSVKLSEHYRPLEAFLDSPIIQALPLKLIGLSPRDVIELVTRAPQEVGALLNTLAEIANSYGMHVEHFFHAMLRSYQETHDNYFDEIEVAAAGFRKAHRWKSGTPVPLEALAKVLGEQFGVLIDETSLERHPELAGFRSVWVEGAPEQLLMNPRLSERQKAFQIAREIGYRDLKLKDRGITSSRAEVHSFEQVLNDFKASYYAGALLIDREALVHDLKALFGRAHWDGDAFLAIMQRFGVTPEMFLYRITQLAPKEFGLRHQHFVRVTHDPAGGSFHVTKQFNMAGLFMPTGTEWNEHYCRRWLPVSLLGDLAAQQKQGAGKGPVMAAQRAHFVNGQRDYFLISLARPLTLSPGTNASVTLGFLMDEDFRKVVRFAEDRAVPQAQVNETCQRCGLSLQECAVRAAPRSSFDHKLALEARNRALEKLLAEAKGLAAGDAGGGARA
jgi:hypothetical protein